jgi:ABC-type uncharacterized transport system ATPase subunit
VIVVLKDVSLQVPEEGIVTLLGANGASKLKRVDFGGCEPAQPPTSNPYQEGVNK